MPETFQRKPDGGQAELGFGQVLRLSPGHQGQADAARVDGRVDAGPVEPARSAGGKNYFSAW